MNRPVNLALSALCAGMTIVLLVFAGCGPTSPDEAEGESVSRPAGEVRAVKDAEALKSLPYIMGKSISPEEKDQAGTRRYKKGKACDGYNLYHHLHTETAVLIDMEGNVVHTWNGKGETGWTHVEMDPSGNLFAVENFKRLLKLDKDSNVIMSIEAQCHHDVSVDPDGNIVLLTDKLEAVPDIFGDVVVVSDYISFFDAAGRLCRESSILEAIAGSGFSSLLPSTTESFPKSRDVPDPAHTNSIYVFDGGMREKFGDLYAKGNILLSIRRYSLLLILDPTGTEVLWGWGPGVLSYQHHATVLDNGNILLFDNGREFSRALEVTVPDGEIAWSYGGTRKQRFFSGTQGSAQRLPNGNTLVGVSDDCFAFEVTPDGEVVWTYVNPETYEEDGKLKRRAFYRMTRIPPELNALFE